MSVRVPISVVLAALLALTAVVQVRPAIASETLARACPDGSVPEDGFTDVPVTSGHEYAIDCLVWWQVTNGTSRAEFSPQRDITRAQLAQFLAQAISRTGLALDSSVDHFDDDAASPFEKSINELASYGVINGTGYRTFSPSKKLNRGQMAALLVGAHEKVTRQTVEVTRDWFDDDNDSIFENDINKVAEIGITYGVGNNEFQPRGYVNRAQMGSFLARLLDGMVEAGVTSPPWPAGNGQHGNDGDPCDVNACAPQAGPEGEYGGIFHETAGEDDSDDPQMRRFPEALATHQLAQVFAGAEQVTVRVTDSSTDRYAPVHEIAQVMFTDGELVHHVFVETDGSWISDPNERDKAHGAPDVVTSPDSSADDMWQGTYGTDGGTVVATHMLVGKWHVWAFTQASSTATTSPDIKALRDEVVAAFGSAVAAFRGFN